MSGFAALIARPASAADVQAVVGFARAHGLLTAVKCGGHSHSGQSTCDRGLPVHEPHRPDRQSLRRLRDPPCLPRLQPP